ncbi:sugar phosphate isomerase/epimerase family protein [Streptomyces chartreusis]|uniref:sugar phosphate isomerase/epimerase family protein n=1 Tax=Streptomyces chartreusis TaxID=1969 RepID=UPI00367998A6
MNLTTLKGNAMTTNSPDLVFWASNSMPWNILDRAEAVAPGGYTAMSCMVGDLGSWEASGRSIKQLKRELDARSVRVSTIDPYLAWYPGFDPEHPTGVAAKHAEHLIMTEEKLFRWAEDLGATYVSTLGTFDGPRASFEQLVDALGGFTDRAAQHGIRPHLEPIPTGMIHDLAEALALVQAVDRPNLGLLLDTYNLGRAGVDPQELESVPHELVFQLQLADGAGIEDGEDYFADAFFRRALPGQGSFPMKEMIAALARSGPLATAGPEVLNSELHELHPRDCGPVTAEATRKFLDDALADIA